MMNDSYCRDASIDTMELRASRLVVVDDIALPSSNAVFPVQASSRVNRRLRAEA
jgi:hypothetical protein